MIKFRQDCGALSTIATSKLQGSWSLVPGLSSGYCVCAELRQVSLCDIYIRLFTFLFLLSDLISD